MRSIDTSLFAPYEKLMAPGFHLSEAAFSLCGGSCAGMFRVQDGEMLKTLVRCCIRASYPFKVLGGMTNILVSDAGYDGIILLNRKGSITHNENEKKNSILLKADSGTGMAAVVRYCIENEISGMEWAAGLPGTVGGAVCGNAGAFGTAIADILTTAEVIDADGSELKLTKDDLDFTYRKSAFKRHDNKKVLLSATFELTKGQRDQIESMVDDYRARRKASQPVEEHSLGSVFKNPEGMSAGKLIQDAGLKGYSIGNAAVSMKHANFITTTEGVTAEDYYSLVLAVQAKVLKQSGVLLEPEIEMFGFGAPQ